MRIISPSLLATLLLLSILLGCSDSQEYAYQENILDLERKIFERTGLKSSVESKYNLNLSNEDYLTYLSMMDSTSLTSAHIYLQNKQLEAGQRILVSYRHVTEESYRSHQKTGKPIEMTLTKKWVNSKEEYDSFVDSIQNATKSFLTNPDDPGQELKIEKGSVYFDMKTAAQAGNFQEMIELSKRIKKKVALRTSNSDDDDEGPFPCDQDKANERTNCGDANDQGGAPPVGHFIVEFMGGEIHINIYEDRENPGELEIDTWVERDAGLNDKWTDRGSDVHYNGDGPGAPWIAAGSYRESINVGGQTIYKTTYLEFQGYVQRGLDGSRQGAGWQTSRSDNPPGVGPVAME